MNVGGGGNIRQHAFGEVTGRLSRAGVDHTVLLLESVKLV